MKLYLAGKITGDPKYHAKFMVEKICLMLHGYTVITPSVLPNGMVPGDCMRISFAMLDSADIVAFLPVWPKIRGDRKRVV